MPPLPAVPGALRVILDHSTGADTTALSHLYFAYTGGPPTGADCAALATSIKTQWGSQLALYYSDSYGLESVTVRDLSSTSGAEGSDLTPVSGTDTGQVIPAGVAVLINAQIARRYRGGKPRVYIPFGTADVYTTAGQWSGAFITGLQTHWRTFIANVGALTQGGTTLNGSISVSYYNAKALRPTPVKDSIISWTVNARPASQRRRNLHGK